jgi:hypothetical protein
MISLHVGGMWDAIRKLSIRATTMLQTSSQSEVCTQSYRSPKVARIPVEGISGLPLGNLGTKWHLGADLVAKHIVYYKREGDGFPQVQTMMNFVSPCLLVVRPCTKNIATPLWAVWGWDSHSQKWEFWVLPDSCNFRAWQKGAKNLALRCSLYRWKGLEM